MRDLRFVCVPVLLAAMTLVARPVAAQPSFAQAPPLPLPQSGGPMAAGDLDEDGHPDVVVGPRGWNSFSVHLGFGPGAATAAAGSVEAVAVADVDGDGHLDVITAGRVPATTSLHLGNGTGALAAAVPVAMGLSPIAIALTDITGDGRVDIVAVQEAPPLLSVAVNQSVPGAALFATAVLAPLPAPARDVAAGDFDRDGRFDLAVAMVNQVSALRNSSVAGTVTFDPEVFVLGGFDCFTVAVADVDLDGAADLAGGNCQSGVMVALNEGAAGGLLDFSPAVAFGSAFYTRDVVIGAIDADAQPDLVALNQIPSATAEVLQNLTGGPAATFPHFVGAASLPVGPVASALLLVDFSGDGRLDLAVSSEAVPELLLFENTSNLAPALTALPASFAEGATVNYSASATDPDGDVLTFSASGLPPGLNLDANTGAITGVLPYTAAGSYTVTITVDDLHHDPVERTVAFTVSNTNRPPAPGADSFTASQDGSLTVAPPGVLANDTDPDGDVLTATLETPPAHGTLTFNAGGFTYTPSPGFHGTDSFTYRVSDGCGAAGNGGSGGSDPDDVISNNGGGTVPGGLGGRGPGGPALPVCHALATVTLVVEAANRAPVCTAAAPSLGILWPPNHQLVPISINGVTDPESDALRLRITGIFQDEPVNGYGDGHFAPDGQGVGTGKAWLRAERSGSKRTPGNGRVYHVQFTATDPDGLSCTGEVTVGVPHDMKPGRPLVDGGPLYDSTTGRAPKRGQHDDRSCRDHRQYGGKHQR